MIITSNKAIAFYKTHSLYERAKNNYRNIDKFSYPCIKPILFDDSYGIGIMERVIGRQYKDRCHDEKIIDTLLLYSTNMDTRINSDGEMEFLQHGDCKRENIIWSSEEAMVFIDLDCVTFLPPFFDVLHFCATANLNAAYVFEMLNRNENAVRFHIKYYPEKENWIDYIFMRYIMFYEEIGCCYHDLKLLLNTDLSLYPLTRIEFSKVIDKL